MNNKPDRPPQWLLKRIQKIKDEIIEQEMQEEAQALEHKQPEIIKEQELYVDWDEELKKLRA